MIRCPHGHSYGTCLMCYHDLVGEQQSEIERLRRERELLRKSAQEIPQHWIDDNTQLRAALVKAVEIIQTWHNTCAYQRGLTEWDVYWRNAPEMKEIREALAGGQCG